MLIYLVEKYRRLLTYVKIKFMRKYKFVNVFIDEYINAKFLM